MTTTTDLEPTPAEAWSGPSVRLTPALFRRFRQIAYDRAGIDLREGKESLVQARIARRLRVLGLTRPADYLDLLERDETGQELVQFLDVISTNFTSFFREPDHFDRLVRQVEAWAGEGQRRFRFWSSACSTGEEPYTMAMVLHQRFADDGLDWRLLATDLSTRVLAHAAAGRYDEERLAAVPRALRQRYFHRAPDPAPGSREPAAAVVDPVLRQRVLFSRLNLALPPYPMSGPFDVIFCRNVMIYFDRAVRQQLVAQFERLLRPAGLLMTGHCESLTGLQTSLELVVPSVYRLPAGRS